MKNPQPYATEPNTDGTLNNCISVLPNQVCDNDEQIPNITAVYTESFTPRARGLAKTESASSIATINKIVSPDDFRNPHCGRSHIDDQDIKDIEVVDELSSADNVPSPQNHEIFPEDMPSDIESSIRMSKDIESNELYINSKEHKSIIKASITNLIIFILMVVLVIIEQNIVRASPSANRLRLAIAIAVPVKFYLKYSTILMAIYCFEVVNHLFSQIAVNTKDYVQNLYNLVRNML